MTHVRMGLVGLIFGFSLSCIGFTDYEAVQAMLTLQEGRLALAFAGTVALCLVGFALISRKQSLPAIRYHRGSIAGGLIFGLGWALTGACPAIAPIQLGEGHLIAILTIAGISVGILIYPKIHARFFRWVRGSCIE